MNTATVVDETPQTDETTTEAVAEVTAEEVEATETTEGNGRKKHAKPELFIETDGGEKIPAEKVWGHGIFPSTLVREFYQYCRDTEQKPSEIVGKCIVDGMSAVFAEMERTAEERATNRATKALPTDADTLAKQEQKLIARQQALTEQLAAVQARAAAIRSGEVVGGVEPLAEVLGETAGETPAPEATGRRGRH